MMESCFVYVCVCVCVRVLLLVHSDDEKGGGTVHVDGFDHITELKIVHHSANVVPEHRTHVFRFVCWVISKESITLRLCQYFKWIAHVTIHLVRK